MVKQDSVWTVTTEPLVVGFHYSPAAAQLPGVNLQCPPAPTLTGASTLLNLAQLKP